MPYAQVHYPFESKREFEDAFPADFIAEGIDQTRGWYVSPLSLDISVGYRTCVSLSAHTHLPSAGTKSRTDCSALCASHPTWTLLRFSSRNRYCVDYYFTLWNMSVLFVCILSLFIYVLLPRHLNLIFTVTVGWVLEIGS